MGEDFQDILSVEIVSVDQRQRASDNLGNIDREKTPIMMEQKKNLPHSPNLHSYKFSCHDGPIASDARGQFRSYKDRSLQ
jgi:hypothetical protein